MKIGVVNEKSSCDKNQVILSSLKEMGLNAVNIGMTCESDPELTYIHTGLISALVLNMGYVDYVVGGCGTGIGFMNSVAQYPGVICGHVTNPLDAWLFTRINGGNCVSLALNQGFGWAGEINLKFILEKLFDVPSEHGTGYPVSRQVSQKLSRETLTQISTITHHPFHTIVSQLPEEIIQPILYFPSFLNILDSEALKESPLKIELRRRKAL